MRRRDVSRRGSCTTACATCAPPSPPSWTRAETYDGQDLHPLVPQIDEQLAAFPWVATARSWVRDQGYVFHVESFVVPATSMAMAGVSSACRPHGSEPSPLSGMDLR